MILRLKRVLKDLMRRAGLCHPMAITLILMKPIWRGKIKHVCLRKLDQDYNVGPDGTVTKTVTVNYKNPYPPSDCNLARGNLCLNAVLRDWFRIYVPKGSQLISDSGSEVKMTSYEDLGKTVFEGFLTVRPQGVAKLTVSYKLPFKLASSSTLPLLIQNKPERVVPLTQLLPRVRL